MMKWCLSFINIFGFLVTGFTVKEICKFNSDLILINRLYFLLS